MPHICTATHRRGYDKSFPAGIICSSGTRGIIIPPSIMMTVVFFMGMFINWVAILLVVVPIFTPIAMDMDFNPLWFAMMICINLQTSFLTPPFGYSLFYFKGVAPPEYSMGDVYRGIVPFVTIQIVALSVLIFFPQIITYLPNLFFGR